MPYSRCTAVEVREWTDRENNKRMAFRCTFDEVNADAISILTGAVRSRSITLFGPNAQADETFKTEVVDKNRVPNRFVMTYACPVKPYCRTYSQNSRNHQAGEIIRNEDGSPKIYTTINVDCFALFNSETNKAILDDKGAEQPANMAEVQRIANNQREYFINNDDANGVRRFYEPELVMNLVADVEEEAPLELPTEQLTPTATPNATAPRFDPITGKPLAAPIV